MRPWVSSPDKVKSVVVTLADGINQSVESIEIADGECTDAVNVDSLLYPTLQTHEGHTQISLLGNYVTRLFKFKGVLYAMGNRGVYKLLGNSWIAVYEYDGIANDRLWDSAMFFDGSKLYYIDGVLPLQQYDGSVLSSLSDAPAGSAFMTTHANRFYLANKTDNLLSFSGLRDAEDWSSTDKYVGTGKITVETPDGEKPTGLTTFGNHVILFKRYTMHKLFGEDSTNFNMTQPYGVGCISHRSIVPTRDSLYWLGPDGFYDYMGGAAPTKISDPIKDYIDQINMTNAQHCCAGTDGRFVYLSLVIGSSESILPNITFAYDLQGGRWWKLSYVISAFFMEGKTLYFATSDGRIMQSGGDTYNGTPINWSINLKPFSEGDETIRKTMNRLWVVADIEPGSSLNVSYAVGTEGGEWIKVYGNENGTGRIQSMKIPLIVRTPETWYRLRLWGTGKVKIHRIIREVSKRNG